MGADSSNVWAVGGFGQDHGTIIKYDGDSWNLNYSLPMAVFQSIMGADASNVWAVGEYGRIFKYDGHSWKWQNSTTGTVLIDVWVVDTSNVYAVTPSRVYKYDGNAWALVYTSTFTSTNTGSNVISGAWFNGIWGQGSCVLIAGNNNLLLKHDQLTGDWNENTTGGNWDFFDIWAIDSTQAWTHAGDNVFKYDGTSWKELETVSDTGFVSDIWGLDINNIWAVGENFLTYDGSSWQEENTGLQYNLNEAWGMDDKNIWATSYPGFIYKYDGTSWSQQLKTDSSTLSGIWGNELDKIWAVGGHGAIFKYDGNSWISEKSNTTNYLSGIWGEDENHVWVVGAEGTIIKYNGNSWEKQNSPISENLNAIWGADTLNIWAVGSLGTVLRYNGNEWVLQERETHLNLFGVWGVENGLWVTGFNGTVMWTNIDLITPLLPPEQTDSICLFPNPVQSVLKIKGNEGGEISYQLFDVMGRTQMEGWFENNEVNISQLSSGLYFLKIQIAGNYVSKSIIKH